jgi:hypothetical protein
VALATARTLRELLLDLGRFLNGEARQVTATAGTNQSFTTPALAYGANDRYVGSELFLWDTPVGITGQNPFIVASSTGAGGGVLQFTQVVGPNPVIVGARAVLQNIGGKGFPQDRKLWALKMALDELGGAYDVAVSIATPDQEDYWNAIPVGIRSIARVVQVDPTGLEWEIAPAQWQQNLDTPGRRIMLPYSVDTGWTYALRGRQDLSWAFTSDPPAYTTVIQAPPDRLVKDAAKWLYLPSRSSREQEIAGNLYNDRLRTYRDTPRPGEVFLP